MATFFEEVFNKSSIYNMLFFNVKSVLIHPTLSDLEKNDKQLFDCWQYIAKTKYRINDMVTKEYVDETYLTNATHYPEFCKIVAITYAKLSVENNTLKRDLRKIVDNDEKVVIDKFMDYLYQVSGGGNLPILCGYNIVSNDIPLLIKRFILLRNKSEDKSKQIPIILKRALNIKPWESGLIDVINVWKFNGFDNMPFNIICDCLGLKKTIDLLPAKELSDYYWSNINDFPKETLDHVSLQSATQTNLVIQFMNEIRQM
jgi:hypothetical protein